MNNFVQPGDIVRVTAPYNVNSGQGVLVGNIFGIGTANITNSASGEIMVVGVFDLAKANAVSTSVAAGGNVHWDDTNKRATVSASSNLRIGVALVAASNTDATVRVRLSGAW